MYDKRTVCLSDVNIRAPDGRENRRRVHGARYEARDRAGGCRLPVRGRGMRQQRRFRRRWREQHRRRWVVGGADHQGRTDRHRGWGRLLPGHRARRGQGGLRRGERRGRRERQQDRRDDDQRRRQPAEHDGRDAQAHRRRRGGVRRRRLALRLRREQPALRAGEGLLGRARHRRRLLRHALLRVRRQLAGDHQRGPGQVGVGEHRPQDLHHRGQLPGLRPAVRRREQVARRHGSQAHVPEHDDQPDGEPCRAPCLPRTARRVPVGGHQPDPDADRPGAADRQAPGSEAQAHGRERPLLRPGAEGPRRRSARATSSPRRWSPGTRRRHATRRTSTS